MTAKRIDQLLLFLPVLSAWLIVRTMTNELVLKGLMTAVLAMAGLALGYLLVGKMQGKQKQVRIVALTVLFILEFVLPLLVDTALTYYKLS